jgi:DNA repair photolyase
MMPSEKMGDSRMKSELFYKSPKTLLNKGTGYLSGYTHSLNPYTGCSFGCSYCYVRQMPVALFRKVEWGTWVDIKLEAANLLRKELLKAKAKGKVTIFMSSSTDPYQPIEYKERVTRSLLEVMVEEPPDFLLVQTRSPLVRRDIDLLHMLKDKVRVSMTIETDLEDIRKHFTPEAPPINARLKTLELLKDAGVPAQATIAPVLPSSEVFPEKLRSLVSRVCVDDYFMGDGSGGKRTRNLGIKALYENLGLEEWYDPSAYRVVYDRLKQVFTEDQIFLSQKGFEP